MQKFQAIIETPFAKLGVQVQNDSITSIDFMVSSLEKPFFSSGLTEFLAHQIGCYLQNPLHKFEMSLLPDGTEFQKSVWQIMQTIEAGNTLSYGDVALMLNSSPRAVGNACRRNPIPLLIPCHRIVAKNGLGGFAGQTKGSVFDIKRWLLNHEAQ